MLGIGTKKKTIPPEYAPQELPQVSKYMRAMGVPSDNSQDYSSDDDDSGNTKKKRIKIDAGGQVPRGEDRQA